ncbi:hypothetical protein MRX96_028323 [Rhipicephalus microplus]
MSFDPERSSTNGNESPELEDVDSPWAAPSADKRKVEVVLVTGSSGFLGQHVVKLLQELDKNVKEIRLFDIKPYENKLKHSTEKPMKATVGDICNAKAVQEAFAGVDCVIHTAALVDCTIFPDAEAMEAVNVEGTRTVIDACIRQNVPYLVFTSTVDVVTKHRAEQLVLQANQRVLADGHTKFSTLVLRPTAMYGEEDQHFVVQFLRVAKSSKNTLTKIRSVDERFQVTYVGNAALAHLRAMEKLAVDESVAGEVFYVTDDTPLEDMYEFLRPFVECQGCRLSDYTVPYLLAILVLMLLALVLRLATLRLNYYPNVTPDEAVQRSVSYYKSLQFPG